MKYATKSYDVIVKVSTIYNEALSSQVKSSACKILFYILTFMIKERFKKNITSKCSVIFGYCDGDLHNR